MLSALAKVWILVFACLVSLSSVMAKSDSLVHRYFVGSFATNAFRGDLSPRYRTWMPGWHVGFRFNKKRQLNGTFQFSTGRVVAEKLNIFISTTETPRPEPVNYVSTRYFTVGYDLQVNLLRYRNWLLHAGLGFHLMQFNPRDIDGNSLSGEDRNRTRARGESYGNISSCFPTLAGITYFFPNHMGLGVQAGWLNQATAYFDNMKQLGESGRRDNVATIRFQFFSPLSQKKK
jgi:hypothetical protein